MIKVLVVAPHADDEVLGCGGAIARHVASGDEVTVLILGKASATLYDEAAREAPLREAREAHSVLGVGNSVFREFPAPMMDTVPIHEIADAVRETIFESGAETVYVPHRGDVHQDHSVVFNAALVAARPVDGCPVRRVLAYETMSETEWAPPFGGDAFVPNVFLDVTATLDRKIDAMKKYGSQIKEKPHPRSEWGLRALAEYRGSTVGVAAAEAFALIRDIG